MQFLQSIGHTLLQLFDAHQLPVLFALLFAEADGVFLPIPGDTFLALAATQHPPSLGYAFLVIGIAILAVNLGALGLFSIMRHGGRRFIERYGKYIFLNANRLNHLEHWYSKRGNIAITVGWLLPGTRIFTAVLAGLANVSYRVYVPFAFLGSIVWACAVYGIGTLIYVEGPAVGTTLTRIGSSAFVIIALIAVLGLIGFNVWHGNQHRRRFRLATLKFLSALEHDAQAIARDVQHETQVIGQRVERGAQSIAKRINTPHE
jgi:membrane protein DedA with SNARE-associated domain